MITTKQVIMVENSQIHIQKIITSKLRKIAEHKMGYFRIQPDKRKLKKFGPSFIVISY